MEDNLNIWALGTEEADAILKTRQIDERSRQIAVEVFRFRAFPDFEFVGISNLGIVGFLESLESIEDEGAGRMIILQWNQVKAFLQEVKTRRIILHREIS